MVPVSEPLFFQTSPYTADLDGDGDNDVLTSSPSDGIVVWYENTGGGNFSRQQILAMDGATFSLTAFDRDGDGDLDIFGTKDNGVIGYENLGSGSFGTLEVIVPPSSTNTIVGLDVENDGDLDLVRYGGVFPWAAAIYWHENVGGNFGSEQLINNTAVSSPLKSVDVDGDGLSDLAFFNSSNAGYLRNLGGGNFSSWNPLPYSTPLGAFPTGSVSPADLDADGDIDFVLMYGALDTDRIVINENLGSGVFGPEQLIGKAPFLVSPVVLDVNNDGTLDIVASKFDDAVVSYENLGGFAFATEQTIKQQDFFSTLSTGDLDGDGDLDVLENSQDLGEIAFLQIDGAPDPERVRVSNAVNRVQEIIEADLDGDGDLDVLSASRRRLTWFENEGSGSFGKATVIADQIEWHTCTALDADGDGDIDVIAASRDLPEIGVWLFDNLGSGDFAAGTVISIAGRNSVFGIDLDGDGDDDIVSTTTTDDIVWNENIGGSFGTDQLVADLGALQSPEQIITDDLDGDGDQDLVVANYNAGTGWVENLGGGLFGSVQFLYPPVSGGVLAVAAADIDGDGMSDIVASPWSAQELVWYQNAGGGLFNAPSLIASGLSDVRAIKLNDFDLDGDADLFAAVEADNKVIWFENLGGSFGTEQLINSEAEDAYTLAVGDFSGDGAVDLAYGLNIRGFIGYHKNLAAPVCSPSLAPDNLAVNFTAPAIVLSWDPISQSVACQINAQRISPPGPSVSRNFLGFELATASIPTGVLPAGTSWNWRIRCSCTASAPFAATPFSVVNTFSVPAPRIVDIASEKGQVKVLVQEADAAKLVSLFGLDGKLISQQVVNGSQSIVLRGQPGLYLLRVDFETGDPITEKVIIR